MRAINITLFLFLSYVVTAQQYGTQWVLGYYESVLDFRNDTLVNYAVGGPLMPMFLTSANICDSSGNLLYYTNGVYIAGADGNQIENGDSLSPCDYTNQWAGIGLNIPQGALFLPMPGNDRFYYLLHMSNDTSNEGRPGKLYYSIMDADANQVISKNNVFYRGVCREGGMTACKHANGRDWWIIMGDRYNTYYKFLLTPDGISRIDTQTIGPSYHTAYDVAYSKFSQDGSQYATGCLVGQVLVMDFDRCSGEFSNPKTFSNQENDPVSLEFSPNGRFLYVTNSINLAQFDLYSSNIQNDSIPLYQAGPHDVAKMGFLQLAPNGKIYATCFNGGFYFIHAVNYPDSLGLSCDYVDTAFTTLTANSFQFPNMVNYQLGPLVGSGCDTIRTGVGVAEAPVNKLRIMPNPADKYLYVEMGAQGNYEFDLINDVGQVVDKKETRQVDNFDTEHLASGIYFLQAIDKANPNKSITRKVVVQH